MAKGFHGLLQKMKDAARALKWEVVVLQLAMRDPRVSILPKVLGILTVGYLVSPIDLIPDFIPVLGLLDDLILIPVMIRLVIWLIPKEIIADLRRRAEAENTSISLARWPAVIVILAIWLLGLILVLRLFRS